MKFATLLFLIGALFLPSSAIAQQETARLPSVTVHGQGEVRVAPDEVIIHLGAQTFDPVMTTARSRNAEIVRNAIAAIEKHGVKPADMKTSYVRISPLYAREDMARTLHGYTIFNELSVHLREVSKLESLLTAVLQAGITDVHGVYFQTSRLRSHRDQARNIAMKAAQEKAAALAEQSGRRLGDAIEITEGVDNPWERPSSMNTNAVMMSGGDSESDGSFAAGQITITSRVTVTYRLQ